MKNTACILHRLNEKLCLVFVSYARSRVSGTVDHRFCGVCATHNLFMKAELAPSTTTCQGFLSGIVVAIDRWLHPPMSASATTCRGQCIQMHEKPHTLPTGLVQILIRCLYDLQIITWLVIRHTDGLVSTCITL